MNACDQCFVCLEEGGEKFCECSLRVHEHCLLKMISSMPHDLHCALCKTQYPVEVKHHRIFSPLITICYSLFIFEMIAYVIWIDEPNMHHIYIPLFCASLICTTFAHIANKLSIHNSYLYITYKKSFRIVRNHSENAV